jgi:hypothetical protein
MGAAWTCFRVCVLQSIRSRPHLHWAPTHSRSLLENPQTAFVDLKWENMTAAANGKIAGFVDFDWGNEACSKLGPEACASLGVSNDTIFATMFEKAGDWDSSWDPDVHFVRSDDYFRTTKSKVGGKGHAGQATGYGDLFGGTRTRRFLNSFKFVLK